MRVLPATGRWATFDAAACMSRLAARRPERAMDITFTVVHSTMDRPHPLTQAFTAVNGPQGPSFNPGAPPAPRSMPAAPSGRPQAQW
ncbi:hypothetical protein D3C81_2029790 [compost metagenome]